MDDISLSPYAQLVRRLQADQTDVAFAAEINVTRPLVTDVKKDKRIKSKAVLNGLLREFDEYADEIQDAYNRSVPPPKPRLPRQGNTLTQRQMRRLITDGRLSEAKQTVVLALESAMDDSERRWLYEQLALACFGLNQDDEGLVALAGAIEAGMRIYPGDRKLIELRNDLAGRHQRRDEFEAAHIVLDDGLQHNPTASLLWRRKGVVHYYEHAYSDAYAALMVALKHKQQPGRIIHVRGAVLAEWGNYDAAIKDLDNVLALGNRYSLDPVTLAHARSNRAYALAKRGRGKQAMKEFATAERATPGNAWLHYLRSLCYLDSDETESAVAGLTQALTVYDRPLNLPKRQNAERLLGELGAPMPEKSNE